MTTEAGPKESASQEVTMVQDTGEEDFSVNAIASGESSDAEASVDDKSEGGLSAEEEAKAEDARVAALKQEQEDIAKEAEESGKTVEEITEERAKAKAEANPKEKKGGKDGEEEDPNADLHQDGDPNGFEKRIGKATRRQRDAERRAEIAEKRAATAESLIKARDELGIPPQAGDFETNAEFTQALVSYEVKKQKVDTLAEELKKVPEIPAKVEEAPEDEPLEMKLQAGAKKYKDFDTVVRDKAVPLNKTIVDATLEMPNTEDVLYFLGKNPDEARKLVPLTPVKIAIRVKEISDTLKSKEKKISKTPDPIKPVKTQGGGITSMDNLPYPEYVKQRKAQMAGK